MSKVFLGGTCNDSTWRDELIPMLRVDYFNPVVDDWTEEFQKIEYHEKENLCNIHLYVITPRMTGVFSIAEIIDSAHDKNKITVVYVMPVDGEHSFDKRQMKSLDAVCNLAHKRGAILCHSLSDVACEINQIQ